VNNYIPYDIVFSILSKLPIKSFKRFECVQKSWSLLFQNHNFINKFRINLFSNTHCRCSYYDGASLLLKVSDYRQDKYDLYSLSGERFQNKVKLVCSNPFWNRFCTRSFGFGSINGILCLYDDSYSGKTILWNPATQTRVLNKSFDCFLCGILVNFLNLYERWFGFNNCLLNCYYFFICAICEIGKLIQFLCGYFFS
jgi:hypothetical protein